MQVTGHIVKLPSKQPRLKKERDAHESEDTSPCDIYLVINIKDL